jgi:hypothetical protein
MLGTARTIGILVNPRYTHFVNATAHRGAHEGTWSGLGSAERFELARRAVQRVPGLIALHRKAVKRAL